MQRVGQQAGVQQQGQRQADGQVAALFCFGVAAQPDGGHHQQQRGQRQVNELAGGQQHTTAQQQRQPGRGESLLLFGSEGRIQQQRRKGEAQPQQRGIAAEAGRQVQRHGQQRRHGEHPLAKRRDLHGQRCQRRKQQQVCQPPQEQRRGKPQVQHIRQEHRRRTDHIQKRILVGLQFVVLLVAVKWLVSRREQLGGKLLPGKDRRVLVLQIGVLVAYAAEGGRRGHFAHPPFITGQIVGPAAGEGEALVDVVFFVRRGVGRQHKAVQQPKAQHQHKYQTVQRQFFVQHCPHGKCCQQRRKAAHDQEEPGQVAADALVGDLHGHRAVHGAVSHRHLLFPKRHAVAVANGQNRVGRVVGRHGQPVAAALLPGHDGVQAQRRVLVRHDIVHRSHRAGQFLAGVGVIEHYIQLAAGLCARQVKFKAYRQNILVVGKHLLGGLAVMDQLRTQEIGDDLAAALAHVGAHLRQPDEHHARQQHDQRRQGGQQRFMVFPLLFHGFSQL